MKRILHESELRSILQLVRRRSATRVAAPIGSRLETLDVRVGNRCGPSVLSTFFVELSD